MEVKQVEGFNITGLTIRTSNSKEMSPEQARIGNLWHHFNSEYGRHVKSSADTYGLYTNYESDQNGFYDVVAGATSIDTQLSLELNPYKIATGKYLVFSASGEMPKTVVNLWQEIWQYFEQDKAEYTRAFSTDFEHYKDDTHIDIYISIW